MQFHILANFTAEPLGRSLEFWRTRLGFSGSVSFAGYNQVIQELLDPGSEANSSAPGANLILVRLEDWARNASPEDKLQVVQRSAEEFLAAFAKHSGHTRRSSIVFLCRPGDPADAELHGQLVTMTQRLRSELANHPGLLVCGHEDLVELYPVEQCEDFESDRVGHIPFAPEYWTAVGTFLMRRVRPLLQSTCKVIVTDADNTLWEGVAAESGPANIEVREGHRALQQFLLSKKRAGILLALASKNNEEDVAGAFAREDMLLKPSDFVSSKVNWQPKSSNILEISRELNLGLDSFIFLDDNPVECAEVSGRFPEVTTALLPSNSEAFGAFLNHLWAVDLPPATRADKDRTEQYRQQSDRHRFRSTADSFSEFIERLELHVCLAPVAAEQIERAAQLTQRTNQFNANGLRRTTAELAGLLKSGDRRSILVGVRDRFGDYGEVGLCVYELRGGDLVVENFLLSCRVLGKGVEHRMLAELGRIALEAGAGGVVIPFKKTERNEPVERFLNSVARDGCDGGRYRIPAERAFTTAFQVDEHEADSAEQESSVVPPIGVQRSLICAAADISRTLGTVAQIHMAIHRHFLRQRPALPVSFVAASSAMELSLERIWEDVLGISPIGVHDPFIELGGQSIQAAQVAARVASLLGIQLPLSAPFNHPTIEQMAAEVGRLRSDTCSQMIPTGTRPEFSPVQERMWFLDQFIPRRSAYNIAVARRLRGTFDLTAWRTALRFVVQTNETLATIVTGEGNSRELLLIEDADPSLRIEKRLTEQEAIELLQADAGTPFNLSQAPLLRSLVVSLSENDHFVLLNVHHIAADGWSMNLLLRQLSEVYSAAKSGRPFAVPDNTYTYADYSAWLRARVVEHKSDPDLEFWRDTLKAAPELLELPTDSPRPSVMAYDGASVLGSLSAETTTAIENLARSQRATAFMVLMAAFQTMLHRYSGQTDILVGTPVAGRGHPAWERLVGCFINTIVIRSAVESDTSFLKHLAGVRLNVLQALAHQEYPFEKLVDELGAKRDLSHSPYFQVMLVLQNSPPGDLAHSDFHVNPVHVHNGGAKFDLVLEVIPDGSGYRLELEYNKSLFEAATALRMLGHLQAIILQVTKDPGKMLGEIEMLSCEEIEQLNQWNRTARDYPKDVLLHELFEDQAERTAGSIAVSFEETTLTYRELDNRANQLACHLQGLGVRPDDLVGVFMERSLEMVVALYGILKAGGAYVPIDPEYPRACPNAEGSQ